MKAHGAQAPIEGTIALTLGDNSLFFLWSLHSHVRQGNSVRPVTEGDRASSDLPVSELGALQPL